MYAKESSVFVPKLINFKQFPLLAEDSRNLSLFPSFEFLPVESLIHRIRTESLISSSYHFLQQQCSHGSGCILFCSTSISRNKPSPVELPSFFFPRVSIRRGTFDPSAGEISFSLTPSSSFF